MKKAALGDRSRSANQSGQADPASAFHGLSLHEGLGGWVLLLKDYNKRARMALEESELLLQAIEYLRKTISSWGGRHHGPDRDFGLIRRMLMFQSARLRTLTNKLEDDLIVIRLLMQPGFRYADLDGLIGAGLPSRQPTLWHKYHEALKIVWSTEMSVAFEIIDARKSEAESVPLLTIMQQIRAQVTARPTLLDRILDLREVSICEANRIPKEEDDAAFVVWLTKQVTSAVRDAENAPLLKWIWSLDRDPKFAQALHDLSLDPLRRNVTDKVVREIVDLVVRIADWCWIDRRDKITDRVSRFILGDTPESGGWATIAFNKDFFGRIQHYHHEFELTLDSMRALVDAYQQRLVGLPTTTPSTPHLLRRAGQAMTRCMLEMLDEQHVAIREVLRILRPKVPTLVVDLVFEYAFGSQIICHAPTAGLNTATIRVPLFFKESPRYFVNIAHEIAHALLPDATIAEALSLDPSEDRDAGGETIKGWDPRVVSILQVTADRLAGMYDELGSSRSRHPAEMLIAEVLSDFAALCINGPNFLYSLLFSTIGIVGFDSDHASHGRAPSEQRVSQVHPIMRVLVAIRVAREMWKLNLPIERENRTGGWRDNRFLPLLSIVSGFLRLLETDTGFKGRQTLRVLMGEVRILGDALSAILGTHRDAILQHAVRRVSPEMGGPDTSGVVASEEYGEASRLLAILKASYREIDGARFNGDAIGLVDKEDLENRYILLRRPSGAEPPAHGMVLANGLAWLWNSVLKRSWEAAFSHAWTRGCADSQERFLDHALWYRVPEVRPLLRILGADASVADAEEATPAESDPLQWPEHSIVTLYTVKLAGFAGETSLRAWEKRGLFEPSWVFGGHDLQGWQVRFDGIEKLGGSSSRDQHRDILPEDSRHGLIRAADFEVLKTQPHLIAAEPTGARAFLRIRLTEPPASWLAPLGEDIVLDGSTGVQLARPYLRSFAWDDLAIEVVFDNIFQFFDWHETLVTGRLQTRSLSLLLGQDIFTTPSAAPLSDPDSASSLEFLQRIRGGTIDSPSDRRTLRPTTGLDDYVRVKRYPLSADHCGAELVSVLACHFNETLELLRRNGATSCATQVQPNGRAE